MKPALRHLLLCASLCACLNVSAGAQEFSLGLEIVGGECGGEFEGAAGDRIRVEFVAYLESSVPGATGYAIAVGAEGPGVSVGFEPCDKECAARRLFPEGTGDEVFFNSPFNVDPNRVPLVGPLAGAPQGPGFVDGVAVSPFPPPPPELPAGRSKLFEFWVEVEVPEDESGVEVVVRFKDGLQGPGEPILNGVTFQNLTEDPDLGSCSFTVRPVPPVVLLDISGDPVISTPPLQRGGGIAYVTIDSRINQGEGIAGWQFSIAHSESIRIVSASPASELFDLVPDLEGSVGFDATQFTPDVPRDLVYLDRDPPDPLCELTPGEAQGPGLVSGVVFAQPPSPEKEEYLPGNTSGPVRVLRIEFEQAEAFTPEGASEEGGWFDWANCLRGQGVPLKTGVTVKGKTILPVERGRHEVTFRRVDKSKFQRGDANGDGEVGDLSDAVFVIKYIFPSSDPGPRVDIVCVDAADSNDDEKVNIADPIHMINALFRGGDRIGPFSICDDDDDSSARSCPPGSVLGCQS